MGAEHTSGDTDREHVVGDNGAEPDDSFVARLLVAIAERGWCPVAGQAQGPRARLLRVAVPPEEFRRRFRELVEGLATEFRRFAASLVGPVLAEDVVQEACARVWQSHLRRPREIENLEAYVHTAVRNEARTVARDRRLRASSSLEEEVVDLPGRVDIEATVLNGELRAEIESAFGRLTPREREVTLLRVLADQSEAETARMLGITPGAVGSCLRTALGKLRRVL